MVFGTLDLVLQSLVFWFVGTETGVITFPTCHNPTLYDVANPVCRYREPVEIHLSPLELQIPVEGTVPLEEYDEVLGESSLLLERLRAFVLYYNPSGDASRVLETWFEAAATFYEE